MDEFNRALRIGPLNPMHCHVFLGMALAYFVARRYVEAIDYFETSLIENLEAVWVHRGLAAAAAMAGDEVKAAHSVKVVEAYAPWIRAADIVAAVPYRDDDVHDRSRQALLLAGFKL